MPKMDQTTYAQLQEQYFTALRSLQQGLPFPSEQGVLTPNLWTEQN